MMFPLPHRSFCAAGLLFLGANCLVAATVPPRTLSADIHAARAHPDETVMIPGPLRSFLRMAGISQEVSPDEVVPLLARSVSLHGYDFGKPTEFLILLNRYVHFAREVHSLVGDDGSIHVNGCESVGKLIEVLGYKQRGVCGGRSFALMTADPERAFLTSDSGFPLTALERALEKSEPFSYAFPASAVPIFFTEREWLNLTSSKRPGDADLLDMLLHDENLDRLYWALSKCDDETKAVLQQNPGLRRMFELAPAFELYGSGIRVRDGKVVLPTASAKDWEELVGASPASPADFVTRLLSKDHGWLSAYFDAVSRLTQTQQAHLEQDGRLQRLFFAYRAGALNTEATSGVFPRDADLLMLLTSVNWNENGEPDVPGELAVWQDIFAQKRREDRHWAKRTQCCDTPERLLEALVANSHVESDSGPVQIFLTLSALDAGRSNGRRLAAGTEKLIASKHTEFNRWFPVFAEFPALDDAAVVQFLGAADHIDAISNPALRANALGAFQAEAGLWQVLARQGEIPNDKLNASWLNTIKPFASVTSSLQLFEAARGSLQGLLVAASGRPNSTQDEVIDLLAGPAQQSEDGRRVHMELAQRIHAVMDDQRLVSLDTLFGLYDGLTELSHGSDVSKSLLPLAGNLREFEMPRPIFSGMERSNWSPLVYTSRHAELQVRTDLTKIIQGPASPPQLENARGELAPFLRDTLVGLNYAYYEPPGAEVLHNNPLFVRSHDFSSISVLGVERIWGDPSLIGVGATAGGGAYLMGSLANLPYALAETEGELISPKNVQALIWREAVPDLLVDAVLPRWWSLSRDELHAAALYQRTGEELLDSSAKDPALRAKILSILSDRMTPSRLERAEAAAGQTGVTEPRAVLQLVPAEAFYLAVEFRKRYPDESANWSASGRELDALAQRDPGETQPGRLSRDFGVPHSTLLFTNACGLLNMKPPPAFGGNASRLLAQSWESDNLYWARLADEMGYSPVMLNILVPALTRRMVVNIFASNIDDWPALSRAMRETGEEFRRGKFSIAGVSTVAGNE